MEHQNEHRMEVPSRKGVSRIEALDGPTGRQRWPDDVKARVCDVAQKYGLIARHVSQWRGLARKGKLVWPGRAVPRAWHEQCFVLQVRTKHGGMDASLISQMKAIEDENRRHMIQPNRRHFERS